MDNDLLEIDYKNGFKDVMNKSLPESITGKQREDLIDIFWEKELNGEYWHEDFKLALFFGIAGQGDVVKDDGGFIYLLHTDHGIKIGKSKKPDTRTKILGTKLPFKIIKKESFPVKNMSESERHLHKKYKECRLNGEWFDLSEKQLEDIRNEIKQ